MGLGIVLIAEAAITCLDLDHVLHEGHLDVRAQTIIDRCGSFTEISPSGTGIHIFVRGRVPRALKGEQFEVYSNGRYIAVTGHRWPGTPLALTDQQPYLDHLLQLDARGRPSRPVYTGRRTPAPDDLAGALLARLHGWSLDATRLKPWRSGYLIELAACPWADEHTTGPEGAAVAIHDSGAFDFFCHHAHCAGRRWREFRIEMETRHS